MQLIKLSEAAAARRRVPVALVDDTDGKTPETGITFIAGDIKVSKAGGAEANHAGTVVELATGDYYYEPTAGEVGTLGYLTIKLTKAGVRTFRAAAQVVAFDPYAAAGLGLTNLDMPVTSLPTAVEIRTEIDTNSVDLNSIITMVDDLETRLTAVRAANLDLIDDIRDLLEATRWIDTGVTPWALVLIKKGTGALGVGTELLRQALRDTGGVNLTTITQVVGQMQA